MTSEQFWIEIAKLCVSVLGLCVTVMVAWWIARATERFKSNIWADQKLAEHRLAVFKEVAPKLNEVFCYFYWVGDHRSFSPADIRSRKRELDRAMHVASWCFSPVLALRYREFVLHCFAEYQSGGAASRLRTAMGSPGRSRKDFFPGTWDSSWDSEFTANLPVEHPARIVAAYERLMAALRQEIQFDASAGLRMGDAAFCEEMKVLKTVFHATETDTSKFDAKVAAAADRDAFNVALRNAIVCSEWASVDVLHNHTRELRTAVKAHAHARNQHQDRSLSLRDAASFGRKIAPELQLDTSLPDPAWP